VNKGWVKLHRKLLDSPVFKNYKTMQVFMFCLLKATHEDYEEIVGDQFVKLSPGQLVTGRKAIAAATKLSEQNTRTALKKLEKLEILTINPQSKYSIISITNWDEYQETNQQPTNSQPTSNQQVTTNKNTKNTKNNKNTETKRFTPPELKNVSDYFVEKGITDPHLPSRFIDHYQSNGWLVGKNKMKDWKAAVRTWVGNNKPQTEPQSNREYLL